MSFDFVTAWIDWAKPEYEELPVEIVRLIEMTQDRAGDLSQNRDLSMPWPDCKFRVEFEKIETSVLANASLVVYSYGHWGNRDSLQKDGIYWKFSRYCDQVIINRFPIIKSDFGYGIEIHQGIARLTYSGKDEWHWEEIGVPVDGNWTDVMKVVSGGWKCNFKTVFAAVKPLVDTTAIVGYKRVSKYEEK